MRDSSRSTRFLSVPLHTATRDDGLLSYATRYLDTREQSPAASERPDRLRPRRASVGQSLRVSSSEGRLAREIRVQQTCCGLDSEDGPWSTHARPPKDDTRCSAAHERLRHEQSERFLADKERFTEHTFSLKLPPLTARFVQLSAELKDAHGLEARLKVDGAPSDSGWLVPVPGAHRASARVEARPFTPEGAPLPGLGRDFGMVWVAIFTPSRALRRSSSSV